MKADEFVELCIGIGAWIAIITIIVFGGAFGYALFSEVAGGFDLANQTEAGKWLFWGVVGIYSMFVLSIAAIVGDAIINQKSAGKVIGDILRDFGDNFKE